MYRSVEPLEPRRLLAATLDSNGLLSIIGTKKVDTIFVTYGPEALDQLSVQINRDVFKFNFSQVKSIFMTGGASGDHIEFRAFAQNAARFSIPSTIYGSTGDDLIIAGAGADRIYGGTGNDNIFGNDGRDIIYGEENNDAIDGGQGNDYLSGGAGNDMITGGLGSDRMYGDEGDDTFLARGDVPFLRDDRPFTTQNTFDRIEGGGGRDRADSDPKDRLISIEEMFRAT